MAPCDHESSVSMVCNHNKDVVGDFEEPVIWVRFWNFEVNLRRHLLQMTDSERSLKCQSDVKSEVRIVTSHHDA